VSGTRGFGRLDFAGGLSDPQRPDRALAVADFAVGGRSDVLRRSPPRIAEDEPES